MVERRRKGFTAGASDPTPDALSSLDGPTGELLYQYFFEERSQSEIAARIGVSQMQVSRLLTATLRRLRARIGPR